MTVDALEFFKEKIKSVKPRRILEIGTRRVGKLSTVHKYLFPSFDEYICADIEPGIDVDVIADVHRLLDTFEPRSFDCVIADALLEHLEDPWTASRQMILTLKPKGLIFIDAPFSFPEHNHPIDCFRFTRKGLEVLFSGLTEIVTNYHLPNMIEGGLGKHASYYMVRLAGVK